MSKGPGKVQRVILDLMAAEPDGAWTVEDLCERVYLGINRVEKKNRVVVLRAVRKIIDGDEDWTLYQSENTGCTMVLVNLANVMSYALGRLKADGSNHYRDRRTQRFVPHWVRSEEQLREQLGPGGNRYHLVEPGGPWDQHVAIHIARRDGDAAKVEELQQDLNRGVATALARLRERS